MHRVEQLMPQNQKKQSRLPPGLYFAKYRLPSKSANRWKNENCSSENKSTNQEIAA
jgi:hypothetical protein